MYKNYLKSDHWQKARKHILNKKGQECKACLSNKNISIHHRYYKDENGSILKREKGGDLVPLCCSCHKLWHNLYGYQIIEPKNLMRIRRLLHLGYEKKESFEISNDQEKFRFIWKGKHSLHKNCDLRFWNCYLEKAI